MESSAHSSYLPDEPEGATQKPSSKSSRVLPGPGVFSFRPGAEAQTSSVTEPFPDRAVHIPKEALFTQGKEAPQQPVPDIAPAPMFQPEQPVHPLEAHAAERAAAAKAEEKDAAPTPPQRVVNHASAHHGGNAATFEDLMREAGFDPNFVEPSLAESPVAAPDSSAPERTNASGSEFSPASAGKLSAGEAQQRIESLHRRVPGLGPDGAVAVLGTSLLAERTQSERPAAAEGGIHLQEGQHLRLVRDGAYAAAVDSHNRLVSHAFEHGHEFQNEQAQERRRDPLASTQHYAPTASSASSFPGNPVVPTVSDVAQPLQQQGLHQLPTYQTPQASSLPSGMTSPTLPPGQPTYQDSQHLLQTHQPKPALKNPWLWLLVSLLLAAFFGATFIA